MTVMISLSSLTGMNQHLQGLRRQSGVSSAPPPPSRRGSCVPGLTPAILVTSHQSPSVRRQSTMSHHLLSPATRNFSQSSYSINSSGRRCLNLPHNCRVFLVILLLSGQIIQNTGRCGHQHQDWSQHQIFSIQQAQGLGL